MSPWCWAETKILPDIPAVEMGLFRINRELLFGRCSRDEQHVRFPHGKGRRALLRGRKGSWEGYSKQSPWLFLSWLLARKEEESSFFLLGSAVVIGPESSPLLVSRFYLTEVSVHYFFMPAFNKPSPACMSLSKIRMDGQKSPHFQGKALTWEMKTKTSKWGKEAEWKQKMQEGDKSYT